MSRLRAFLIALTIFAVAFSPLLIPSLNMGTASNGNRAFAAPASQNDNGSGDDDDDNSGDDDDDDDNDEGGDNSGDDDDDNNDDADDDNVDDDNGSSDNDNESMMPAPVAPAAPAVPVAPSAPACSTPGQEMTFASGDGRVTVRVFGTTTESLKLSIRIPVDPASLPVAPGPIAGGIVFQIVAEKCDTALTGVPVLPAEVNLGVHYSDGDAAGLNEATFALARLDTGANRWGPSMKQANDPPANYVSATITEMGYYVLYQRS